MYEYLPLGICLAIIGWAVGSMTKFIFLLQGENKLQGNVEKSPKLTQAVIAAFALVYVIGCWLCYLIPGTNPPYTEYLFWTGIGGTVVISGYYLLAVAIVRLHMKEASAR